MGKYLKAIGTYGDCEIAEALSRIHNGNVKLMQDAPLLLQSENTSRDPTWQLADELHFGFESIVLYRIVLSDDLRFDSQRSNEKVIWQVHTKLTLINMHEYITWCCYKPAEEFIQLRLTSCNDNTYFLSIHERKASE